MDLNYRLEKIIQSDPGNRGLNELFTIVQGSLKRSVELIETSKTIAILTGFNLPPQETDGPPGAIAIARALESLGKKTVFIVDDFCHSIIRKGIIASNISYPCRVISPTIELFDFSNNVYDSYSAREKSIELNEKYKFDSIVAIEHVGPSYKDGKLYRMDGSETTINQGYSYIFYETIEMAAKIAIGDGGNEIGCGKILPLLLDGSVCKIPHIEKIACKLGCDELIISGVSNWAGYALAIALTQSKDIITVNGERNILESIIQAGTIDSAMGSQMYVDRMPFDTTHSDLIQSLLKAI